MIRFIAVIDSKKGMADEQGIPWLGKLPTDMRNFRQKTINHPVLMGYRTYAEFKQPLSDRQNYVASREPAELRPGFEKVTDAREFLQNSTADIWVIGGPVLFKETLNLADELYLTRLEGDFGCTKFFPDFEDRFELIDTSPPITENNLTFRFTIWRKK